ncbi:MAG: dTDP-4-dehydrorhamnose 3,5-epimerase [Flavobacteriales bacterium]
MKIERTPFEGLLIIQPDVFGDDRGWFFESFSEAKFRIETGLNITFVQDNESMSQKGVVRGLHFQVSPKAQAKLIRVSRGRVMDVVVDLRRTQPTYGKHFAIELSAEKHNQLFVPEGFAHGFAVLEDDTLFTYKCSNYYSKDHERALRWNDPALGIEWGVANPVLSDRDRSAPMWSELPNDLFF